MVEAAAVGSPLCLSVGPNPPEEMEEKEKELLGSAPSGGIRNFLLIASTTSSSSSSADSSSITAAAAQLQGSYKGPLQDTASLSHTPRGTCEQNQNWSCQQKTHEVFPPENVRLRSKQEEQPPSEERSTPRQLVVTEWC